MFRAKVSLRVPDGQDKALALDKYQRAHQGLIAFSGYTFALSI